MASLWFLRPRPWSSRAPPLRDVEVTRQLRVTDVLGGVRDAVDEPVADSPPRPGPFSEGRLALLVEPAFEPGERVVDPATYFGRARGKVAGSARRNEFRVAIAHDRLLGGFSDDVLLRRCDGVGHKHKERVRAGNRWPPVDGLVIEIGDGFEEAIELVGEANAERFDFRGSHQRTRLTTKSAASRRASRSGRAGRRSSARRAASWKASARCRARSGPLDPRISASSARMSPSVFAGARMRASSSPPLPSRSSTA